MIHSSLVTSAGQVILPPPDKIHDTLDTIEKSHT